MDCEEGGAGGQNPTQEKQMSGLVLLLANQHL